MVTPELKRLATGMVLAASLTGCACSKASPPSPVSSQTSPGPVGSKPGAANDSSPREAALPKVAPDGSPLFERFVRTACALSRSGDIWCPRSDLSQSLEYEKMNYPAHVVRVASAWPFNYLLTAQGQVFIAGKFVPTAPGAKEIDYSRLAAAVRRTIGPAKHGASSLALPYIRYRGLPTLV